MWVTFWYHIILHLVYCRVLCTLPQTACEPRFTKCWPKINHVTSLWPDIMSWNIIITRRNRQPEQLSRRPFSVDNQGLGHVFLLFFILTVSWWVKCIIVIDQKHCYLMMSYQRYSPHWIGYPQEIEIWCQENYHAIFLKNLEHFMEEEVCDWVNQLICFWLF